MRSSVLKYLLAAVVVLVLGTFDGVPQTRAQDSSEPAPNPVPLFWRLGKPDPAPDLSLFPKLRVITGEDYPPFHFRDAGGQLTGFDVELIRGICSTLRLNCEISTGPFDNILQALEENLVDIAAASVARSATNLRRVDLTKPYFRSPAVFSSAPAKFDWGGHSKGLGRTPPECSERDRARTVSENLFHSLFDQTV